MLSILLAPLACASLQTPAAESADPQRLRIRAARMLDVVAGRIVANPEIEVADGRIVAVRTATGPAPTVGVTIDLGDVTLAPGLVDCHTHLAFELDAKSSMRPVLDTPADIAIQGVKNARTTVLAGITTVRDLGSSGFTDVALMRAVERGDVLGPWIVPAGNAIGITGGHADVTGFAPGILPQTPADGVADGVDECLEAVRTQIKHGAKAIKIMATAGVLSFEEHVGAQQLSFEEMKAICDEAARHGVKVAAHAHGAEGLKAAIRAGVASIEHGSLVDDEAITLMLERGTFLVPTQYLLQRLDTSTLPDVWRRKAEWLFPRKDEGLRKAIARGVKIAFGTDAGVYPHGENARELATYVAHGMTPLAAIRSATTSACELLGLADRGSIEAGKLADLVAVPGDPLQDVRVFERVTWVMHGGRVVR